MADLRAYQPSFTAGELSPALWARVDLSKYSSGLKTAVNLFIHPHGGASNRAGLEFIREVKTSAKKTRLIPFQFNTSQSYILEFGDLYFRVYRDGGIVLSGASPYEVVSPYAEADLADLVFVQEADVMYITHPLYAPRKLSRLSDTNWTIALVTFAPTATAPTGLVISASYAFPKGAGADLGFKVTAVSSAGGESAASSQVTKFYRYETPAGRYLKMTWNAVSGAVYYKVYKTIGDGDEGYVGDVYGTEYKITTYNGDNTNFAPASATGSSPPATPGGVSISNEFGKDYRYAISNVDDATGEESLPSSPVTVVNDMIYAGNKNLLSWTAVSGSGGYLIYREDNGVFGYIGRSETTAFVDENITADIADGPQEARNPFSGAGNYPRCCTFIEQRLAFASTINEPQAAWLSQSANYQNFGKATPAKASDAVTFRLRARQVNEIRGMLSLKGLILLGSGGEFLVTGGSQSDAITPGSIKVDAQGYRGCSKVQPVVVGNTVLFSQDRGGVVRDFSFDLAQDGFSGRDLTILARHLFEGRSIKAWGYAQAPYSIVWTVLDDGSMVSLTYLKEHEVWAWTRHETDGTFEDVAVIAEGSEDVPYFIVRRTIQGTAKRYIERLHTRSFTAIKDAFFVDSGLSYSGTPISTVSLPHLAGKTVSALVDGNSVRGLVVSAGGSLTLPNAGSTIHVGLPYTAALQTLDLDLGTVQGLGTAQGRYKSISECTLRVEKTRGMWVGPTEDALVEYKQRAGEAWNAAIQAFTGDVTIGVMWDWDKSGATWVKQFDPLPMTILALMPDLTLGR